VANLDGSAHVFKNEYAIVGTDSVLLASDGTGVINPNSVTASGAKIILRGDPDIKWFVAENVPQSYWSNFKPILVPNEVTIPSGSYKGQKFSISLESAYKVVPSLPPNNTSFYYRSLQPNGSYYYEVGNFKSLPAPVALNGVNTATDSANFKSAIDSLNSIFGFKVFVLTDVATLAKGCGMLINYDPSRNYDQGSLELSPNYCGGHIEIGVADSLWSAFGVWSVHAEAMHVLGGGHTCEWVSILQSSCGYAPGQNSINPGDVAYTLLMWRVRDMERQYDTRFSLGYDHQGERMSKGLSLEPVALTDQNGSILQ
jgi:hypothetical protein